jgi:hypothetical protein
MTPYAERSVGNKTVLSYGEVITIDKPEIRSLVIRFYFFWFRFWDQLNVWKQ